MQSEIREALARPLDAFRSVLSATVEQARGTLASQRTDESVEAAELGAFADDRIDATRFLSLVAKRRTVDAATLERMEQAFAVLLELAADDALCEVQVEPGGSLRGTVAAALARAGRAFGAARVFDLARSGRFRDEHAPWLESFPFAAWNRSERAAAPPLVVTVNGRDLFADGLAEFLDGATRIVLVAQGEAPRAPLVRLITPGTCVLQTNDAAPLREFAACEGPGIALVANGTARFAHRAGTVTVEYLPETPPPPFLGGRSAAQQLDELAQLERYAAALSPAAARRDTAPVQPAPGEAAGGPAGGLPAAAPAAAPQPVDDSVDRLASWLIAHANLEE